MKIAVVGTGYVGLVTGTCFAETGNEVTCIDIDESKVKKMQNMQIPIYEPGLEVLFARNIKEGRLSFTDSLEEGMAGANVIFLALPTPPHEDGSADLSYILGAAEDIGGALKDYAVIVDKSTVPVGTAEKVHKQITLNASVDFDVISNPEFLREGRAVEDFMHPDRVVIGSSSSKAQDIMKELYAPLTDQDHPLIFMDEKSAEMTKYAANAFLATKISFINEVANLCEEVGADVEQVRVGVGMDARIGMNFLYPGVGYGGSCFPKDVQALAKTAQEHGYDFRILNSVMQVNKDQRERFIKKILNFYEDSLDGKTIGLWGLAFKPDTDDIREAPSLDIISKLTSKGARVVAFDPEAISNVKKLHSDNSRLEFRDNEYSALEGADALIVATEWKEFLTPDFEKIKKLLKEPVVFDGRNIYNPRIMKDHGFHYESIGRI